MNKVTVVGTGAWGTALAIQAIRAGNEVVLVARDAAKAAELRRTRQVDRLPGILLPACLHVTDRVPVDCDLLLWAVPAQFLRASLAQFHRPNAPVIVCAKGIEARTNMLPLEVVRLAVVDQAIGILTGPNFAREVADGLPAATVIASIDANLRAQARVALGTPAFRLYGNDDPIGAQIGGAAKNVVAIAAGAVIGAGLGENARAALVTRGLSELSRLTVALGGRAETVMGLSGVGDLLLTCTGVSSRNFSLGRALGQGNSVADALANSRDVVEGVTTAAGLVARAGRIEMPICEAVASLLDGSISVNQAISQLLSRPNRDE